MRLLVMRLAPAQTMFAAAVTLALLLPASARADDKPAEDGTDPAAMFTQLDANKDGKLTEDEIPESRKRLFERLLRSADKDKDGKLTAEEFSAGLKPRDEQAGSPEGKRPDRPRREGRPEGPNPAQLFKRMDKNSDGKVTPDEVPEQRRDGFKAMLKRGDKNGDGALDEQEFAAVFRRPDGERPEGKPPEGKRPEGRPPFEPEQMFKRLDSNGDGKISAEEIQSIPEERRRFVERLLKRGDKDGDKMLSLDELKTVLAQGRPNQPGRPERGRPPASPDGPPGAGGPPGVRPPGAGPVPPAAPPPPGLGPPPGGLFPLLDANHDGKLSSDEIAAAAEVLKKLDKDGDGSVTFEEIVTQRPRPKE